MLLSLKTGSWIHCRSSEFLFVLPISYLGCVVGTERGRWGGGYVTSLAELKAICLFPLCWKWLDLELAAQPFCLKI